MTDTQVMAAVEPCPNPFCEWRERDGDFTPALRLHHHGNYRVVCTSCILEGPTRRTKDEAIAAWNHRASSPAAEPELTGREYYDECQALLTKHNVRPTLSETMQGPATIHYVGIVNAMLEFANLHRTAAPVQPPAVDAPDNLKHKIWMIISHATGGELSNEADVDRSTNDICVRISAFRNKLYQAGKDAAAVDAELIRKALEKIMPIRVHNGPDYAEVYFADGSAHSTQAMTVNPQDWLDIQAAYDATPSGRAQGEVENG